MTARLRSMPGKEQEGIQPVIFLGQNIYTTKSSIYFQEK